MTLGLGNRGNGSDVTYAIMGIWMKYMAVVKLNCKKVA